MDNEKKYAFEVLEQQPVKLPLSIQEIGPLKSTVVDANGVIVYDGADSGIAHYKDADEFAALIVKSINSYEPMQDRIKDLEKAVTMVLHCLRDGLSIEKDDPIHQTLSRVFPELIQSSKSTVSN